MENEFTMTAPARGQPLVNNIIIQFRDSGRDLDICLSSMFMIRCFVVLCSNSSTDFMFKNLDQS